MALQLEKDLDIAVGDIHREIDKMLKDESMEAPKFMTGEADKYIYDKYKSPYPTQYVRRWSFIKEKTYSPTVTTNGNVHTIEVAIKDPMGNPDPLGDRKWKWQVDQDVIPIIESGSGYRWLNSKIAKKKIARPFVKESEEDFVKVIEKKIKQTFKKK